RHNYAATVSDHLALHGGTLDSTVSLQRYDATIGGQGGAEMILTPTGNRGNYFSSQIRNAARTAWLQTWSPAQIERAGTNDLKFGTTVTLVDDNGISNARPIEILDTTGLLMRRIDFTAGSRFGRQDLETSAFAQDHWNLNSRLALNYGGR